MAQCVVAQHNLSGAALLEVKVARGILRFALVLNDVVVCHHTLVTVVLAVETTTTTSTIVDPHHGRDPLVQQTLLDRALAFHGVACKLAIAVPTRHLVDAGSHVVETTCPECATPHGHLLLFVLGFAVAHRTLSGPVPLALSLYLLWFMPHPEASNLATGMQVRVHSLQDFSYG